MHGFFHFTKPAYFVIVRLTKLDEAISWSEIQYHRSRRASLNAQPTENTFIMVKEHFPGYWLQSKSLGGANGDTSSTMSALGFVTDDILA
jgi:hypothetical protein